MIFINATDKVSVAVRNKGVLEKVLTQGQLKVACGCKALLCISPLFFKERPVVLNYGEIRKSMRMTSQLGSNRMQEMSACPGNSNLNRQIANK